MRMQKEELTIGLRILHDQKQVAIHGHGVWHLLQEEKQCL